MARPLRSVSSVRVSLTVRTKQWTRAGAADLCSFSDTQSIIESAYNTSMARALLVFLLGLMLVLPVGAQAPLDRDGERWVDATMKRLTLDEMVGQLLMPRFSGV